MTSSHTLTLHKRKLDSDEEDKRLDDFVQRVKARRVARGKAQLATATATLFAQQEPARSEWLGCPRTDAWQRPLASLSSDSSSQADSAPTASTPAAPVGPAPTTPPLPPLCSFAWDAAEEADKVW